MRTDEFNQKLFIKEYQLQPEDVKNPKGNWSLTLLWEVENLVSGILSYSHIEKVPVAEAIERGIVTVEEYEYTYRFFAKISDMFYKSIPLSITTEEEPQAEQEHLVVA